MKTHHEKDIQGMDDKTLMNFIYSHIDRAQDRNSGAQKNLLIFGFPTLNDEGRAEKITAVKGYLIQLSEDLSALRFATKNFHKRLLKNKRKIHNMQTQIKQLRGERDTYIADVEMPDLWNVGEFTVSTKQRTEVKA